VTRQPSYWDLVKEAFRRQARLPMIGKIPLNYMYLGVMSVLGIANPGFWLLGAAGEMAYLALKSSSDRFKKVLEGERLLAARQTWDEQVSESVEKLSPASRDRYRRLLAQCRRIVGIAQTLEQNTLGSLKDLKARNLNQLLAIFLRLLLSREVIAENLKGLDRRELEKEIARMAERLHKIDPEKDAALERSLRGTVDIQKKRLGNLERAESSLNVIDAELLRIEQQVQLIREEAAVVGKTDVLSDRLDAVTTTMAETEEWMRQHSDLIAPAEVAIDVPGLSELPTLEEEGS
jgi:hypothetical protein